MFLPRAGDWNKMNFQPKLSCDFVTLMNLGLVVSSQPIPLPSSQGGRGLHCQRRVPSSKPLEMSRKV